MKLKKNQATRSMKAKCTFPLIVLTLLTSETLADGVRSERPPVATPSILYSSIPGERAAHSNKAADDSSRTRLVRWMFTDLGALAGSAFTPRVALYSAGAVGGTFALAWLDDDLTKQAKQVYKGGFRDFLEIVDYVGGPSINLPVVALAGTAMLTNNITFQDAAYTSLQTLAYAGVLGYLLKGIFGRERPEWTNPDDPYAFFDRTGMNPLSHEGNSSYPSGHAIAAFGILTPWVLYYPSPFTYALYVIPTGTSISRLAHDKHWATDLAVGAVIGVALGRWLTRRHRGLREDESRVSLSIMDDGKVFSLRFRLD